MAHAGAALDEPVLGLFGAQLGGDPLALGAIAGDHAQLDEEQRPVLHVEAAAQLALLDERAVSHHQVIVTLAREMQLVTLVQTLGVTLEQRRRGRHRELHEGLTSARPEHRHQPVHRRFALVGETVEHLRALDELGVLLQAQNSRDQPDQLPLSHEPAVRVGRPQRCLHHLLVSSRACHSQPDRAARVVHLERNRGLALEQSSPPAT